MTTFIAVCDANGPISVMLAADTVDEAVVEFLEAGEDGQRKWIDEGSDDAEHDLGIDGYGLTEDAFAEAIEGVGCKMVRDLEPINGRHFDGGWRLWQVPD